jgi:tRNA(Ile)-lysidine synthase
MLNEFYKHLQSSKLLPPKSKLILAVSGGVDSVAMLHLLHNLRSQYGWEIAVAHYNHGVRKDATKDALLVGDLADLYGYPLYLGKYEYTDFSEAALRKARYDFLEELRRDMGYDYILTAHHNNDFLETAIFNTVRGSDREGMVALKEKRGKIIRPLLPFSKPEIIVFANLQNLQYREDSTNDDLSYSRNMVRNVLMPHGSMKFRNFHHNMNQRLAKLKDVNQRINQGLTRLAEATVEYEDSVSIQLDGEKFNSLPVTIRKNLLVFLVKRLKPAHGLKKINITKAVKFIETSRTGSKLPLPGGLQLVNTYGKFVITSEPKEYDQNTKEMFHILSPDKPFENEIFKLRISEDSKKGIKLPSQKLYVRYRQAGDKVSPIGMEGTKKLQDVFVDAKIPKHLRSMWPVVVNSSNEVIWVPNLVKNRKFFDQNSVNYQYLTCEVI